MPRYFVRIHGDPDRGAGLLARSGIQSTGWGAGWMGTGSADTAPDKRLTGRLLADSPEDAVERVRDALAGEAFTVEDEPTLDTSEAKAVQGDPSRDPAHRERRSPLGTGPA